MMEFVLDFAVRKEVVFKIEFIQSQSIVFVKFKMDNPEDFPEHEFSPF
jgi:hypothetical protein